MDMPPPMVDDDPASDSSSLSSVQSPQHTTLDEIRVARRVSFPGSSTFGEGGVASLASASPARSIPTPVPADAPIKPKRGRKPKEPKLDTLDEKPKEKKPRKPREPKVKNEDGIAPAPRKRQKKEPAAAAAAAAPIAPDAPAGPRQSTLTEMVTQFQTPGPPASAPQPQHILPSQPLQRPSQPDILIRDSLPPPSKPPTPRPFSSGQNFDPIRGSIMEAGPPPPTSLLSNGVHSAQASPQINRASASPSIHSLIDPPSKGAAPFSYSSHATMHAPQPTTFAGSAQHSTTPPVATSALPSQPTPLQQSAQAHSQPQPIPSSDGAMDIDAPTCDAPVKALLSRPPSSVVTPQVQPKDKKAASPKAAGTGLLASSNLFGGSGAKQEGETRGPSIDIRIVLNRDGGNTVNIAQEIFRKYGQDAINPRAAAHRAKLLQVAAAQNKLEGGSADDMSVDLMSDMDGDSNVEMGGMDDEGKSATGADDGKSRRRRKKVEEYDKEDDFIDDTELAWQEAAAVAKDGFFVYSGKLVPEGTTANVESTAPSGRGRGGGRGRGRGRGAATATSGTAAPVAEKGKDPSLPARGRGSRGGKIPGTTRKPRITKAEKEKLEAEKAERERMISNSHPSGGVPMQMSTTNSSTPASLVQVPQQPMMHQHVYTNGTTTGQQHSVQAKPLIPT